MATFPQSEAFRKTMPLPSQSGAPRQLQAMLRTAGVYSLGGEETAGNTALDARGAFSGRGWIRVLGDDRVRWLNGMLTNSIQELRPGQGCYNFVLNPQGRIQGDCYAFAEADSLLLQTDRAQVAPLLALLDRFIIMDDVELRDETQEWSGLGLAGPKAADVLAKLNIFGGAQGIQLSNLRLGGFGDVRLVAAYSPGVPRFELWSRSTVSQSLHGELVSAGVAECSDEQVEWLRILEGIPRYGADIRDKDLPQETAQSRALHFAKGCYIGQEIVERIRSRGSVHRAFGGFRIEGELPPPGTALEADGQKVGEITSSARIPLKDGEVALALGSARREALDRGAVLQYPGGSAKAVPLPYAAN